MRIDWQHRAEWQGGLVSRRQLNASGVDRFKIRNEVRAGRWQLLSPMVVATFTGALSFEQRVWLGHLHAGPGSAVTGIAAASSHGLKGWRRPTVEVLVPWSTTVAALGGFTFIRTRRPLGELRGEGLRAHLVRLEPAVLLRAAAGMPERTAGGLVASAVQQRLTSANLLLAWLDRLQPLPRNRLLRALLLDIRGGAESMAEIDLGRVCRRAGLVAPDRQRRRKDREGRSRWTDAEWDLADGSTLVLEVDGGFHIEVQHWQADLRRQRKITTKGRTVIRATALELRLEPEGIVEDLRALGVPMRKRS
jgi:hypothetical protein